MKKILTASLLLLTAAVIAEAQSIFDAYTFSENNYYGTARSIGMGNALTAIGGDLGSLTLNPAGSAVAGYSQITFSPGFSISTASSSFGAPVLSDNSYKYVFGASADRNYTRMTMPNAGVVLNFNTGKKQGIKSFAVGIVGNMTAGYNSDIYAHGYSDLTSIARTAARAANGILSTDLDQDRRSNVYDYFDDWLPVIAYNSGMIDTYIDPLTQTVTTDKYVGITESVLQNGDLSIPTDRGTSILNQRYRSFSRGSKFDLLLNFGANVSDRFYFGANLGITSLEYRNNMYIQETADDPSYFGSTYLLDGNERTIYFSDLNYIFSSKVTGAGVYGKFGFIVKPIDGLRIGAAIQTPALIGMEVSYQQGADVHFLETSYAPAVQDAAYSYRLRTPWRANAGLAYTFGQYGVVSLDYEMCDYGSMRFRTAVDDDWSAYDYSEDNEAIRDVFGIQHQLRAGAEIKPLPMFAFRAGYNFTTSPEKDLDNGGYYPDYRHSFALGAGYSSSGSFFADLSCRFHILPDSLLYAYDEYGHYEGNSWVTDAFAPQISSSLNLWDVVLTVGWRF